MAEPVPEIMDDSLRIGIICMVEGLHVQKMNNKANEIDKMTGN
jgi:hypothetical protein